MPNDLQLSDQDEVLLESLVLAASDNVTRAPGSDRSQFAPTRRRVFVETDGNENVYLGTGNAWVDVSENTGLLSSLFGGGDGNFDSVDTGSATVTNQVDAGSVNTGKAEITDLRNTKPNTALVNKTSTQTIADNSLTRVQWDQEVRDFIDGVDLANNKITVSSDYNFFRIGVSIRFDSDLDSLDFLSQSVNNSFVEGAATTTFNFGQGGISRIAPLKSGWIFVGDFDKDVSIDIQQSSGSPIDISGSSEETVWMEVVAI